MVQGTQSFRQIWAARCVIPYILCVVCIALNVDMFRGGPSHPYIVGGIGLHGNPSRILPKESFLMSIG